MNKTDVIQAVIANLKESVSSYYGAAKRAHEEATHEENVAEDKYDTRGLEASYLAAGQARQMEEAVRAIEEYSTMFVPKFGKDDPIEMGALVNLEVNGEGQVFFLGPCAGGTEVEVKGASVVVITMESPLGILLDGRKQGDEFEAVVGKLPNRYRILSVC